MQITPGNSHAPCPQPLPRDLTPARDLTLWPLHVALVQLNSICGFESIEHLFTILPKAQILWSAKDP